MQDNGGAAWDDTEGGGCLKCNYLEFSSFVKMLLLKIDLLLTTAVGECYSKA